jgi:hypothetical protein
LVRGDVVGAGGGVGVGGRAWAAKMAGPMRWSGRARWVDVRGGATHGNVVERGDFVG